MNTDRIWFLGTLLFVAVCYCVYMLYLIRANPGDEKELNDWVDKH